MPEVTRNIYVYDAPQQEAAPRAAPRNIPKPKVYYNLVFVRTPKPNALSEPVVVPPPQQKTLIYVLNQKPNGQDQQVIEVPSKFSKPEVYYVSYDDQVNYDLPVGIDLKTALAEANSQQGQFISGSNQAAAAAAGKSISSSSKRVSTNSNSLNSLNTRIGLKVTTTTESNIASGVPGIVGAFAGAGTANGGRSQSSSNNNLSADITPTTISPPRNIVVTTNNLRSTTTTPAVTSTATSSITSTPSSVFVQSNVRNNNNRQNNSQRNNNNNSRTNSVTSTRAPSNSNGRNVQSNSNNNQRTSNNNSNANNRVSNNVASTASSNRASNNNVNNRNNALNNRQTSNNANNGFTSTSNQNGRRFTIVDSETGIPIGTTQGFGIPLNTATFLNTNQAINNNIQRSVQLNPNAQSPTRSNSNNEKINNASNRFSRSFNIGRNNFQMTPARNLLTLSGLRGNANFNFNRNQNSNQFSSRIGQIPRTLTKRNPNFKFRF